MDNLLTGQHAQHRAPRRRRSASASCGTTSRESSTSTGRVDAVLHFASPASPIDYLELPIQTLKVGSLGTHNALGLAKAKNARFLLASTSEVYGDPAGASAARDLLGQRQPDRTARRLRRGQALRRSDDDGLPPRARRDTRIVRIFNTYGRGCGPRDGRVVPALIGQALAGEPMTVFGDGSQTRSFCYVSDLIEGIYRLLLSRHRGPGQHRQPGRALRARVRTDHSDADRSPERDRLQAAARRRSEGAPARHHARRSTLLGWEPKVKLEDGLRKTIEYFRGLGST